MVERVIIEAVIRYRVLGREFDSLSKAKDHVESTINKQLQAVLIERGFSVSQCVKITESILKIRNQLAVLLAYEESKE